MPSRPSDVLWTEHGVRCVLARTGNTLEVLVQIGDDPPFVRKTAQSIGDARNQGEYLRVLLGRGRAPAPTEATTQAPHVLIVEDDPDNLFAYEEMLKLDGFAVASARTIADAKRTFEQAPASAVLLDHLLPDGSGASLCSGLRQAAGGALPIVMVTGLNPREIAIGGEDSPDAVMSKPCRPDLLTALLRLLIGRERASSKSSASGGAIRASGKRDPYPDAT
jgi:CheY-like chemotaxis protein